MMNMMELYRMIGADYQEVQSRLGNEKIIERFIRRFSEDKTFERLLAAYDAGDAEAVYDEVCTFVEVCRSLSLSKLAETAGVIMEAYRPENSDSREQFHVADLFDTLAEQYHTTMDAIRKTMNMDPTMK